MLTQAIEQNPEEAYRLRYVLAFNLYRDRMKDEAKAVEAARAMLLKSPSNDSLSNSAMRWLLQVKHDDAAFQKDARSLVDAARKNMHLANYAKYLQTWARDARKNKDLKERGQFLDKELAKYRDDPSRPLWEWVTDSNKGRRGREELLKKTLSDDAAWHVLYHQAYGLRHRGGNDDRKASVDVYGKMAKRFPEKWDAASWWMDAAASYGEPAQKKLAAEHLLRFPPTKREGHTWHRMMDAAAANKDKVLAKKVLDWIAKAEAEQGVLQDYSHGIGKYLNDVLDMPEEAKAVWQKHLGPNLDHADAASNLEKILASRDDAKKVAILAQVLQKESDNHGAYAAWLADIHFRAGELSKFEEILRKHRKIQDGRGSRKWAMGEWPAQTWIDQTRSDKEASDADKLRVFKVIADMGLGRTSAVAQLNVLAIEGAGKQGSMMKRLLAYQETTMMAGSGSSDWDRLWPYAQGAMGDKLYREVATLLSGMLSNIYSVDNGRKQNARAMIGQAFARMGSSGMEINSDSPIAPLMQISLFLRLGDRDLAFKAYDDNKALFNEHRASLPLELVLFAAETHIAAGGDDNHNQAEDILRSWLVKNADAKDISASEKAKVQLMLGRNYFKAGRFEVARSEFASVKNLFPETEEALEAEFGIGESYMAQKVFDKAEEIFFQLANSRNSKVVIRAEFLRGVLANRQGDRDDARAIFRSVLERMPNVELANETLYNLAEVYGVEQRFTDQLELLRTVGRLGRDSKRWHAPGNALSIVVQDSDLGISRGEARIPVLISTEPGGDEETAYLTSGGAGKGLFLTEIDTVLGAAVKGDNVLQVIGTDTIKVDYPDSFKEQFKFHLLANNEIQIASDAAFEAASSKIEDDEVDTITSRLRRESMESNQSMEISLMSNVRPENQIKPGNPLYFRVEDKDRDHGSAKEVLPIKVVATSGDEVKVDLVETEPHSGIFEGVALTGELPAGALASDTAIEHNPLMAIDHDTQSMWLSEPDGVAPKWLAVDLKDLRPVSKVNVHTPDVERQAPVRMQVEGSTDGRFWYKLAEFPVAPEASKIGEPVGRMTQYVYKIRNDPNTWSELVQMVERESPASKQEVVDLNWKPEEADKKSRDSYPVLWLGKFVQEKAGGVRFVISGTRTAMMVNGHLLQPMVNAATTVDVYLDRGIHELAFFALAAPNGRGVSVKLAREDLNSERVVSGDFRPGDVDLALPEAQRIAESTPPPIFTLGTGQPVDATWEFTFDQRALRHVRIMVNEFLGEAVAINHLEVGDDDALYIPTQSDVLSLSTNNVLELTAGDTALATYIDELTEGGLQRNRILSTELQATYYNGKVRAISYDFLRMADGAVMSIQKDLMRIEPGDRIGIVVTDYDMDTTAELDQLELEVQVNDVIKKLVATETGPNAGEFKAEIDTSSSNSVDRLVVQSGDRVTLRYVDKQNTFPGHTVPRERVVFVNEPTEAQMRIVGTRIGEGRDAKPEPIYLSSDDASEVAGVSYAVPLTVEVYDPDRAMDNMSRIQVALSVGDSTNTLDLTCVVSEAHGVATTAPVGVENWALFEGRFVGQVIMQLGGPGSPEEIPSSGEMSRGLVGWVKDKPMGAAIDMMLPVLNLTGKDVVQAVYPDEMRPDAATLDLSGRAKLITDGELQITDHDYVNPAECCMSVRSCTSLSLILTRMFPTIAMKYRYW